jgi:hypothetical protein
VLDRAYRAFADHNPEWTEALFDHHFLTHTAAPLFAAYVQRGDLPSDEALARWWARQLPTINPKYQAQRISEATTAAHIFLGLLSIELCDPVPQALTRTAQWDAVLP